MQVCPDKVVCQLTTSNAQTELPHNCCQLTTTEMQVCPDKVVCLQQVLRLSMKSHRPVILVS